MPALRRRPGSTVPLALSVVDNQDPYAHTFTVDELGVNQTMVAGQSARVEITAAPGEYRYYCAIPGHEFMEGTLLVQ